MDKVYNAIKIIIKNEKKNTLQKQHVMVTNKSDSSKCFLRNEENKTNTTIKLRRA